MAAAEAAKEAAAEAAAKASKKSVFAVFDENSSTEAPAVTVAPAPPVAAPAPLLLQQLRTAPAAQDMYDRPEPTINTREALNDIMAMFGQFEGFCLFAVMSLR